MAEKVSPLSESNYLVKPACSTPSPGHAGCLALELRARTAAAKALQHPIGMTRAKPITSPTAIDGVLGLSPEDLQAAYFDGAGEKPEAPKPKLGEPWPTIALVDAYNDYHAAADLKVYDEQFGLPELGVTSKGAGCTTVAGQGGCFEQVNQHGETAKFPFPAEEKEEKAAERLCVSKHTGETRSEREAREEACGELAEAEGWSVEISTDIEMARAICQNCKILLVEGNVPSYEDLLEAEQTAHTLGATEISNSWGGEEPVEGGSKEATDIKEATELLEFPGTVVTASSGDEGYLNWTEREEHERGEAPGYFVGADYPASAPNVVAVGGTKLTINDGAREQEAVWNEDPDPEGGNEGAGGGGCSTYFTAPSWQLGTADWGEVGCGTKRAVADIAADADPYTGVAVYDSKIDCNYGANGVLTVVHWCPIGGTSVASPIIASMFALAGGADGVEHPASTLYSHLETTVLHTVTSGGNGACHDDYLSCKGSLEGASALYPLDCGEGELICNAAEACGDRFYDGPTGVGTPNGIGALEPVSEPSIPTPPACKPSKSGTVGGGGGGGGGQVPPGKEGPSSGAPGEGSTQTNRTESTTTTTTSTAKPAQVAATAKVLSLSLTHRALTALRRLAPLVSQVAFTFKLSAASTIHVALAKQVRVKGREQWRTLPYSISFAGHKGQGSHSLSARRKLAAGRYRLTLSLAHGGQRSIAFNAR